MEARTTMRQTRIVLVLAAALAGLGGCATAVNLGAPDGCRVYGGTRVDAALVAEGFAPDADAAKKNNVERPVLVWEACCGLIDLPLSMVADTVLLPITVPLAVQKLGADSQPAEPTPRKAKASQADASAE
jgi:uncharacterized protein YceK